MAYNLKFTATQRCNSLVTYSGRRLTSLTSIARSSTEESSLPLKRRGIADIGPACTCELVCKFPSRTLEGENIPSGVMDDRHSSLSSCRSDCQYPCAMPNLQKILTSAAYSKCASISSIGKFSKNVPRLTGLRSIVRQHFAARDFETRGGANNYFKDGLGNNRPASINTSTGLLKNVF